MFSLRANRLASSISPLIRTFTRTSVVPAKPLPPRIKIDDADVSISYVKGTGPGGQKINKTSSAVQITHAPTGLVVKCQATRSQAQNRKIARSLLADRVEHIEKGDESRVSLKAKAAQKKKASKMKKSRRKYRALDKAKADGDGELHIEAGGLPEQKEDSEKH